MRSKTRIVVLHMKEVIYTTIFIILGIVLIFPLVYMFGPSRHNKTDTGQPKYKAGVYTSSIQFEGQNLDVQVVVDENHINSVSFVNLNDTVNNHVSTDAVLHGQYRRADLQNTVWRTIFPILKKTNTQHPCCCMRWKMPCKKQLSTPGNNRYRTISVQMYTLYVFHPNLTFFCKRKNPTGKASRFRLGVLSLL